MSRKIYAFWTGNNKISQNRLNSIASIKENSKCEVVLVTPDNIGDFILEPFHPAYEYLSIYHRTDYLKCYFAYHYGNGYTDIKPCNYDWNPYFEKIESTNDKELISYGEVNLGGLALRIDSAARKQSLEECAAMMRDHAKIPGVCHYIFKNPKTKIATEWREVQHKLLDENIDILKENPGTYHIAAVNGPSFIHHGFGDFEKFAETSKYPFSWSELGGMIYHEVTHKNLELCMVGMPHPNTFNYR